MHKNRLSKTLLTKTNLKQFDKYFDTFNVPTHSLIITLCFFYNITEISRRLRERQNFNVKQKKSSHKKITKITTSLTSEM